jgi:2,3-bisphosphoglycerate-dependent phosphoglycerate mutase
MMKAGKPALLVLVRHAESLSNVKKQDGFIPPYVKDEFINLSPQSVPITEIGEEQSIVTGKAIKEMYGIFDYVYTSPFTRTRDTTKGMLSAYTEKERAKMQYRENLFLRERDAGYGFAMTKEESELCFPWLKKHWEREGNFYASPPGGESIAKVVERVYQFREILLQRRGGQKVLIVTHGGTIKCFRSIIEHWTPEQAETSNNEGSPINCGVTTYIFKAPDKLVLDTYNQKYW